MLATRNLFRKVWDVGESQRMLMMCLALACSKNSNFPFWCLYVVAPTCTLYVLDEEVGSDGRTTGHLKPRDDPRYLSVFKKERDKAQLSFRSPKTRSRGNVLTVMSSFSLQTPEPSWVNANSKLGHNVTTYRTYEYSSLQNSNRLHETTLPRVTRDACFTAGLLRKPQPKQEAGQRSHSVHISNLDCIKVFAIEEEGKQSQLSVNKNVKSFGGNSRDSCGRSRDSESW